MKENNDLEAIRRLEDKLGKKLVQLARGRGDYTTATNSYFLNSEDRVVGINLEKQSGFALSILNDFQHLSALILRKCSLVDVSPLGLLTSLAYLDLTSNEVTDLMPLRNLTSLTALSLRANQVVDVTPLQDLTSLTALDLGENLVDDVTPLYTLTHLNLLDISDNKIKVLPTWVCQFQGKIQWDRSGPGLHLQGNPLETPPIEVIKKGKVSLANYFRELGKDSVRFLHAKVLLVGQGEVGKTTLMKKILKPDLTIEPGREETTEGIEIMPWSLQCTMDDGSNEDITVHLWDFGGQEIYHSTHQFFLTKRSLYLFVWDARKEEDPRAFDYWLEIVRLLGQESPVIMVMNKADVRTKHIDEKSLRKKFPNIESFHKISCTRGDGLPSLIWQFRETLSRLPHLMHRLPATWLKIRRALEEDPRDHITLNEYYRICQFFGLGPERADFLSEYLHDLGVILHFRTDKVLENTVILNPQWATEAVYKLIDTREIFDNNGRFTFQKLRIYWDTRTYPVHLHLQLVRLMERFELCFNYATDDYFVPELLPPEQPDFPTAHYNNPETLRIEYRYHFMPGGIISRFISRLSYLIHQRRYWKNGVELFFENTTALVQGQPLSNHVRVAVSGPCGSKLLGIIQSNLEHIHSTLNMEKNKHYRQMIPCTCSTCQNTDSPHFFNYEVLNRHLSKNTATVPCDESSEAMPIETLLTGYTPPQPGKSLLQSLLQASVHLTGLAKTIKEDEDSRTGFLRLMLEVAGFEAQEQARWGKSGTGKSPGRVDLLVTLPKTDLKAACEAFNLSTRDTTVIDDHLKRVFYYDPLGGPENFILVYSQSKNFSALWDRYLEYLPQRDDLYPRLSGPSEIKTPWLEIKRAVTVHHREKGETTLHHIFINMRPK